MITIQVSKADLERGFPCKACGHPLQGTSLYRTTCPKCGQVHVTYANQKGHA